MTATKPVPASKPLYDAAHDNRFGPAVIEGRTTDCGLFELGTFFMTYDQDGHSDPWTLVYEETMFVIEGEVRLRLVEDGGDRTLSAGPGELVVLPKGTTVCYGGEIGTRTLLSISPVNWRELQ